MPLRRPLLTAIIVVAVAIAAAVAVFIFTFDLNHHRDTIAQRLSTALERPVHLGEAHLAFDSGIALTFADLRIGATPASANKLTAKRLILRIAPRPLFRGEVVFRSILLDAPRLEVTLEPVVTPPPSSEVPDGRGLRDRMQIRAVDIENGSVRLVDARFTDRSPMTHDIDSIRGRLAALSRAGAPFDLELSGTLRQGENAAALTMAGQIAPADSLRRWRETACDLLLTAEGLDPAALPLPQSALARGRATDGRLAVRLSLTGSPQAGLRLDGEVHSADFALHLPSLYRSALPLREATLSGTWTAEEEAHRFDDLQASLDGLSLRGRFFLHQDSGRIEGELSTPSLAIDALRRLLPDLDAFRLLKENLDGGALRLENLRFTGSADHILPFEDKFFLQEAALQVRNAFYRTEQITVEDIAFDAAWKDRLLSVREGRGSVFDAPFEFAGTLEAPPGAPYELAFSALGTLEVEKLAPLLPEKMPDLALHGPLPLSLELTGPPERLVFDLQADLEQIAAGIPGRFSKPVGLPGTLFLTGDITPKSLQLSHSRLSIPPLELRGRGKLARTPEKTFALVLDLAPLDLQEARFDSPLLEKLSPKGKIAAHYELAGSADGIGPRQGTVSLRDFGVHIPGPTGDLSRANGEIILGRHSARTSNLTARIGRSLFTVQGRVADFAAPRLELEVRSPTVRAADLIFPSEKAVLRDLDGRLVFSGEGIDFAPVRVRLDGGTQAEVRGTLRNFKAPETRLQITAEYGNIDEVIALWRHSGEKEEGKKKIHGGGGKTSLFIDVQAEQGRLGPLNFRDAQGEITLREGVLNIFPLRFATGSGTCTGQVLVDSSSGSPPLLKISGHVEDIDAAASHHELLQRKGLVTGTLSGDFYLEGRAGDEFLASSLGGFDLKVRDGVVLKFKFLSKVFSLLNVSQILSFKLPDMDQKGMPFERLTGTFGLHGGVLSTQDLFIKSNAMNLSLVGDVDLARERIDMVLGVKPLRTVDKIITQIPIAGWLLTGEEKALITAHFQIQGKSDDPEVSPIPITSVSEQVLGVFRRLLELPGKVITDTERILGGGGTDEEE